MKALSTSFVRLLLFRSNNSRSFRVPSALFVLVASALSPVGSHSSWAMVHKTSPFTDVLPILHWASHRHIFLGCLLFLPWKHIADSCPACDLQQTPDSLLEDYFFTNCSFSWICAICYTCLGLAACFWPLNSCPMSSRPVFICQDANPLLQQAQNSPQNRI